MQESGLLLIGKLKQGRSSRPAFFFLSANPRTHAGIRAFAYRKAKARQVEQTCLLFLSVTRTYAGIRAFAYRKAKARQVEQAMLFYLRIQEPMQESGLLQIGKLKQGRSSRPAFFFYLRTQEPMQESGFLHI